MGESQIMPEPFERLRSNATKCRDLASTAVTSEARAVLSSLADDYEQMAIGLEHSAANRRTRRPAFHWQLD
jgi:hypothetical protein